MPSKKKSKRNQGGRQGQQEPRGPRENGQRRNMEHPKVLRTLQQPSPSLQVADMQMFFGQAL